VFAASKKIAQKIWLAGLLALLSAGCGSVLEDFSLPTLVQTEATPVAPRMQSAFVPSQKIMRVKEYQPVIIQSVHHSNANLKRIEIRINGQPPGAIVSDDRNNAFPADLAQVLLCLKETPHGKIRTARMQECRMEQLRAAGTITPEFPTTTQNVALTWLAKTPGTYQLSLVATDENEQESTIVQRIEVR
jgi:hypothetical protein